MPHLQTIVLFSTTWKWKGSFCIVHVIFEIILLFGFFFTINGFDLLCPNSLQRIGRIQSVCNGSSSSYTCLYDTRKKGYTEFCSDRKDNYVRAGLKYVISGTFRNIKCSDRRYQPIRFWSNQQSDCLFFKSQCTGIGQIVYDDKSTIYDATCRCDDTIGYAFVSQTQNPCFCKPSEEDCSCYRKSCPTNTIISDAEYESLNVTKEVVNCQPITKKKKNRTETDIIVSLQDNKLYTTRDHALRIGLSVLLVTCTFGGILLAVFTFANDDNLNDETEPFELLDFDTKSNDSEVFQFIDSISLINACEQGKINIVKHHLIRKKASINDIDNNGQTLLYLSCIGGNVNIVKLLLGKKKETKKHYIDKPNNQGKSPLMAACGKGHFSASTFLINEHADININDNNGQTPFYWSCIGGNIQIVNLLLMNGEQLKNKPNYDNKTPFMVACSGGHLSIVKYLIKKGVDINTADKRGRNPFYWACLGGKIEIVKLLMRKINRSGINESNHDGKIPLMAACAGGHLSVVKRLIKKTDNIHIHDIIDKQGRNLFYWACYGGNIEVVNLLIYKKCEIKPDNGGKTALMVACGGKHLSLVKLLIKMCGTGENEITKIDDNGQTPFYWSCYGGNKKIFELLISLKDIKIETEQPNNDGKTPLMVACGQGNYLLFRYLLSTCTKKTDNESRTLLYWSCIGGNIDIVKHLTNANYDINSPDNDGKTPLMVACNKGYQTIVKHILDQKDCDEIDRTDKKNRTSLFWSCVGGNIEIVKCLTVKGYDLNMRDTDGKTPIMEACGKGNVLTFRYLMNSGASIQAIDYENQTVFYWSCVGGNMHIIQQLIAKRCDKHEPNKNDKTPLMVACSKGHLSIVKLLINELNDIHVVDKENKTLLYWSCFGGNIDIVKLLIDKGCASDINVSCKRGRTPLHETCYTGYPDIFHLLLMNGADPSIRDADKNEPIVTAIRNGHESIFKIYNEFKKKETNTTYEPSADNIDYE